VRTENFDAYIGVKCKVWKSDSAVLSIVPICMYEVSINPIIQFKTRLISHAQTPPTSDSTGNVYTYILMWIGT
jgi:hypothetical protein